MCHFIPFINFIERFFQFRPHLAKKNRKIDSRNNKKCAQCGKTAWKIFMAKTGSKIFSLFFEFEK